MERIKIFILTLLMILSFNNIVFANENVDAIREEIKVMKELYESRITQLEENINSFNKKWSNLFNRMTIIKQFVEKRKEYNISKNKL